MNVDEATANLQAAILEQQRNRDAGLYDTGDDELDDEGVEFIDPSLGHIVHLMDLLDIMNTPAPAPRPMTHRP